MDVQSGQPDPDDTDVGAGQCPAHHAHNDNLHWLWVSSCLTARMKYGTVVAAKKTV